MRMGNRCFNPHWLLFCSLFMIRFQMPAAQQIAFEHLTSKQGLSQSSITSICQDSVGFLWFGTYAGLNRYDGYTFTVFEHIPENPHSISNNFVRTLYVDREGTLWAGTSGGGLNRYNRLTGQFERMMHDSGDSSSISHDQINAIMEDQEGNLWVGTWGGGLNRLVRNGSRDQDGKGAETRFVRYMNDPEDPYSLPGNKINQLYSDRLGRLWISTKNGVCRYDFENDRFIRFHHDPSDDNSLSHDNVTAICEDRRGYLWFGTWGYGLNRFNPNSESFTRFSHRPGRAESISHDVIMSMFRDSHQHLWIGTWGGGLCRLVEKQSGDTFDRYQHSEEDPGGISGNSVYSIFEDRSGVLWVGTDWDGLNKFDPDKVKFTHYRRISGIADGLSENGISAMAVVDGTLWIGTRNSGLNLMDIGTGRFTTKRHRPDDPFSLSYDAVRSIWLDRRGRLWVGTERGLNLWSRPERRFNRFYFDPENPDNTNVNALCDDADGNIWIGNYGDGLVRLDPAFRSFKQYTHDPDDSASIGDNIIRALLCDSRGRLWIGTETGGLNLYDPGHDRFRRFCSDPGDTLSLSDNKISTLFEDRFGGLWIGTPTGLNRMNSGADSCLTFTVYTKEQGLPADMINGILEDGRGRLWISTSRGLSVFDPGSGSFTNYDMSDGLQEDEFNSNSYAADPGTGIMYFGGNNGFNAFHPDSIYENMRIPNVVITDFRINGQSVTVGQEDHGRIILEKCIAETDTIVLHHETTVFSIAFAALHFNSPGANHYAYRLKGFETDWNNAGGRREAVYTNIDPGEYVFQVRASNNDGVWNETGRSLLIRIPPPFYKTIGFKILAVLLTGFLIVILYRYSLMRIRDQNAKLEADVASRTQEIQVKKDEIEAAYRRMNHAVQRINESVERMTQLADTVADTSTEFSDTSQNLSTVSSEHSSSISEISSSLQELFTSASANALNAQDANLNTDETRNLMKQSLEDMNNLSGVMRHIYHSTTETETVIHNMEEIATMIQMLSVNASIEAMRAGEAGKGFQAVAREVQALAEQSETAVQNTKNLIHNARDHVEKGGQLNREVLKRLKSVGSYIEKLNALVADISAASLQQKLGIDQINTGVEQLNQVMKMSSDAALLTVQRSEQLTHNAEELRMLVKVLRDAIQHLIQE
ncbi:hypothetical protein JW948_16310 [bacterium]|nr:hypothetical protein [bacterium]